VPLLSLDFASNASFLSALLALDRLIAQHTALLLCPHCSGALHRADFPRKPRGFRLDGPHDFNKRFSFCCATEGCRKRLTPASVRFLHRRVYLAATVVLAAALLHGPCPSRLASLAALLDVPRRTVLRWCRWWTDTFARSVFFRTLQGWSATWFCPALLPWSLLEYFPAHDENSLLLLLRTLVDCPAEVVTQDLPALGVILLASFPQSLEVARQRVRVQVGARH